jgi:hypothetical protein
LYVYDNKKFHFADNWDKILISLGIVFSIATGGLFPVMNIFMGNIAGALIAYQNSKQNISATNLTSSKW